MTTQRKPPKERTAELLEAAVAVALKHGFLNVTREKIGDVAGVSRALVTTRFGTMVQLRRLIMRQAIERKLLGILAEGLAVRDPNALKAPEDLKKQALRTLSN